MAWLVLVLALSQEPPRVDPVKVDEAIARGVAYVRTHVDAIKPWEHTKYKHEMRPDELVLWMLLRAGIPETDPLFQKLIRNVLSTPLTKTYLVALQAMVLDELDRVKYQVRIAQCAQYLVDNQAQNGQWGYGEPVLLPVALDVEVKYEPPAAAEKPKERPKPTRKIPVKKMKEGPATGDNSNSQYAVQGLRACADAGIVIEPQVIRRTRQWWEGSQKSDGGWCYSGNADHHGRHESYGAMTAGAVASLVVCNFLLGEKWRSDRRLDRALAWLGDRFTVEENAGKNEHNEELGGKWHAYYFVYAMERACSMYGTEKLGKHWWYAEGAAKLLENQKADGSWSTTTTAMNVVHDTCFAILFLRRATKPLQPVVTVDPKKKP